MSLSLPLVGANREELPGWQCSKEPTTLGLPLISISCVPSRMPWPEALPVIRRERMGTEE
jgi:hypothetical protein